MTWIDSRAAGARAALMTMTLAVTGCAIVQPGHDTQTDTATVQYVIDGDTVGVVDQDGVEERVRVLGINAPEDSDREVGCGGPEATTAAVELLDEQTIELRADGHQPDRDKYGRLLRHLTLADGRDFAETMLTKGHAARYTSAATDRDTGLRAAEWQARQAKVGIWATPGCADATQ